MHLTPVNEEVERAHLTASAALQELLPELVALSLNAKQVHWTVAGPAFLPVHEVTDEIAKDTLQWSDLIAERAMALGFTVDARPTTVAATNMRLYAGRLYDRDALVALIDMIDIVAMTTRRAIEILELNDPVGHDLSIEVLHGLERYRWMLRAQLTGRSSIVGDTPEWAPALAAS